MKTFLSGILLVVIVCPAVAQLPSAVRLDGSPVFEVIPEDTQTLPMLVPEYEVIETPPNNWATTWSLLRPTTSLGVEWESKKNGFSYGELDVSAKLYTYPLFGPPPPAITSGFTWSHFETPSTLDLPKDLYRVSVGISWLRPINARWAARFSVTPSYASDFRTSSGDAWRFRGMAFAFYEHSPAWKFGFGAVATGRGDLPVIPGIGAIWKPDPFTEVDLFFPRPKVSWMIAHNGVRETWFYVTGGLGGGTWAFQRSTGMDDVVTYRSWRLLAGIRFAPAAKPHLRRVVGLQGHAELGYVFGRRLEFDSNAPDFKPQDAAVLSLGVSY
jgi:hypothetical protein